MGARVLIVPVWINEAQMMRRIPALGAKIRATLPIALNSFADIDARPVETSY